MRIEKLRHQTVLQVRVRSHPTAGLPPYGESQVISLSNQINNKPRLRSAALQPGQFVVR
jgi:hypothetical protein